MWLAHRWKWILPIGVLLLVGYWKVLPDPLFRDPTSTVLDDRDGGLLGAQIATDGQWRFPHNPKVPQKFEAAIVQFEDRTFYEHPGISARGFSRAVVQNVQAGRVVSGGSTLTMQVVRLMRKGQSRSFWEKAIEVVWATRLELTYSKEEILAMYASNAPFGGNVVGLDAASWRYFGRSAEQLTWAESATLAVLPNAPSLIYPGKNHDRLMAKRDRLLARLHEVGAIDSLSWQLALAEPLPAKPHTLPQLAPHLLERAKADGHLGKRMHTTIQRDLQDYANRMVNIHKRRLEENEVHNAGVLILSVKTGEVLAYVGNTTDAKNQHSNQVDVVRAPRSTGSVLKPLLYGSMLDDGSLMPDELVADVPTHFGSYAPKNFTDQFSGAVPARKALARSLNVPAVRMLGRFTTEKFHHRLQEFGLTTLNRPPSHYGLSLILGGAEATLWDLASVYGKMGRTLRQYPAYNENLNQEPTYLNVEASHRELRDKTLDVTAQPLLTPSALFFMLEAMVDVTRPDQEVNWREFSNAHKVAWKTGTSFGFRDAWAVGLTQDYVVAVWVGNADGEGRPGLVGVKSAAPLLFDLFDRLPQSAWFEPPYADMALAAVCQKSGHRASSICQEVDSVYIPKPCLRTTACPYHQLVHLDTEGKHQVNSACYGLETMQHVPWFVLPPLVEKYYRNSDPKYQTLPPFRDGCTEPVEQRDMALVYPKKNSRIYTPVDLDGKKGKSVFEATHRDPSAQLFWHLNDQFLGTTKTIHQLSVRPEPGSYKLTLVDEQGETMTRQFTVVDR